MRPMRIFCAAAAALVVAGCGGRSGAPVTPTNELDVALSCAHIEAELAANAARAEDLRAERDRNRLRSVARVPGAVLSGNPLSTVALADPSLAVYRELHALTLRDTRLRSLAIERGCAGAPQAGPRSVVFADDRQPPVAPEPVAAPPVTPPQTAPQSASVEAPPAPSETAGPAGAEDVEPPLRPTTAADYQALDPAQGDVGPELSEAPPPMGG